MPELLFYGAAGEVTGSMHMLHVNGHWVALDCGLYQGKRADAEHKNREWPMRPQDIAAVVLSHAHIDHTGRLPLLVKQGFDGPVYATPATRDLCAIMLPDSAHVQEEDVFYVNKKRARQGLPPIEALYDYDDALAAVDRIVSEPMNRRFEVVPGVTATYQDAGHMLGSAGVRLELKKNGNGAATSLFFTGDVGGPDKPIIRDPAPLPEVEYVLSESTYGGRNHETVDEARETLRDAVKRTLDRGGKVVIPSFAVGRTQTLVYYLHQMMVAKELPRVRVYVDSPLAVDATAIFKLHPECYDAEARAFHKVTGDILGGSCCTYIQTVEQSKALHGRDEPCVIISASGMCEAGRVRHHIKNNIEDPRNTILFPGFQAAETLGRRLIEGAKKITLFHEEYQVRAQVVQIHGFSGHADQAELLALLSPRARSAASLFLVHGEPDQASALAQQARRAGYRRAEAGQRGQSVKL
ncbi:MAG: MBL fold metallo-hydrolase [Phycisphaerales bacterium]|nr:MBL fold metallo-hydrolase [Phycisphaerales bacterium]